MTATRINPDLAFVRRLRRIGGEAMKHCYQCGTCTSICPLTPDHQPFPRKEMLWAQWGLKDRLLADPDVWLCHGCGDCSAYCPRGARPSEVMAALRSHAILHYAVPRFLGRWLSSPAYLPLLLAVPVLLMVIGFALAGGLHIPPGEVRYAHLVPYIVVELVGNGFMLLALAGAYAGLRRFWRALDARRGNYVPPEAVPRAESWAASAVAVVREILAHRRFRQCGEARPRAWQHALLFYGFLLLFATSGGRLIQHYVFHSDAELALAHPVKLVGNLGGLAMAAGLVGVLAARWRRRPGVATSTYFDWFLIGAFTLAVATGFAAQGVRLGGAGAAAYYGYLVHLLAVFVLLIYLPYSKFAHLLYRFTALLWARRAGRELASPLAPAAAAAASRGATPAPAAVSPPPGVGS